MNKLPQATGHRPQAQRRQQSGKRSLQVKIVLAVRESSRQVTCSFPLPTSSHAGHQKTLLYANSRAAFPAEL